MDIYSPLKAAFNYTDLETSIAQEAKDVADTIRGRMETAILETGRDLARMKKRLGHGKFLKWIEAEFAMTPRTAQNYMNAADVFSGKYEIVSHLPPSIIYDLSASSTPADLRDEILQRLETGERPSASMIRERVRTAKHERRLQQQGEREEQEQAPKAPSGRANTTQAADHSPGARRQA